MNNDMDAKRKQELADARDNAAQAQAKAADAAENKQNAQEALTQAKKIDTTPPDGIYSCLF